MGRIRSILRGIACDRPGSPAQRRATSAVARVSRRLCAALKNGSLPGGDDDAVERRLLAFEVLASNGLRHGEAPVCVMVTADDSGWLLEVGDAAVDQPPIPAIGRDAAAGGLGLHLVTRLAATHGWAVTAGRKHVWCRILSTRLRAERV